MRVSGTLIERTPPAFKADPIPRAWSGRLARRAVLSVLDQLDEGEIVVREGPTRRAYGRRSDRFPVPVEVEIRSPEFYRAIAFGGTVGSGEAFMADQWRCSDLALLIRIILGNDRLRARLESGSARFARPLRKLLHALRRNGRGGSRRNIAAHYDLGNDFFSLFLDPTMTYSAGVFAHPSATMEEASIEKYEQICKSIDLRSSDHLLEIGTGWGGFAIHAARSRGCRVTTTTISRAQHDWARRRIQEEGLEDRIELLLRDYRDLEGQYDKLVSIEMIEAVGHQYFETFFRVCDERLADHGRAAIQCITIQDDLYEQATKNVDFIKRYIFPGGCLPSLAVIDEITRSSTRLAPSSSEDITSHYAETLRRWRTRLHENAKEIRALGYPETLLRMWEFYFCYCEAGFEARHIGTHQLVFEKRAAR
jgi:cyclopropane-fatty-acyl-phospholipid synthase